MNKIPLIVETRNRQGITQVQIDLNLKQKVFRVIQSTKQLKAEEKVIVLKKFMREL